MSIPNRNCASPIQGAIGELVSAQSALNMEPSPITEGSTGPYLSDSDKWVADAYEHIAAELDYLHRISQ